jgi:hypothetical protein
MNKQAFNVDPALLQFAAPLPAAGLGGLLGYLNSPDKKHKLDSMARGAYTGYLGGAGMAGGAMLGNRLATTDKVPATIIGGLTGGLAGLGASRLILGEPEYVKKQKLRDELLQLLREEHAKTKTADAAEFVQNNPESVLIPLSAAAGGALVPPKKKDSITSVLKGIGLGGVVGAGSAAGALAGKHLTSDPMVGGLTGAGVGGVATLIALRKLLHKEAKAGPVLTTLLQAKQLSDMRDYAGKHTKLRELIEKYPDDFTIDSRDDNIVGLTHSKTGFRVHAPLKVLPENFIKNRLSDYYAKQKQE